MLINTLRAGLLSLRAGFALSWTLSFEQSFFNTKFREPVSRPSNPTALKSPFQAVVKHIKKHRLDVQKIQSQNYLVHCNTTFKWRMLSRLVNISNHSPKAALKRNSSPSLRNTSQTRQATSRGMALAKTVYSQSNR